MRIARAPHRWSLTPKEAVALQRKLAARVSFVAPRRRLRLVAGLDAAFSADGRSCIAGVVLWDGEENAVREETVAVRPLTFPYVPGLLSFREAPALIAALRKLGATPDALMCDGHGFAHPRRFGIACHVGVLTGLPTIGCAKSVLIGQPGVPGKRRGSTAPLLDRGERIGTVLRTQDGVRPVFVSAGHRIDLRACESLVLACATRYRLPEPTRLADQLVARVKRHREDVEREIRSSR
jgi:deoxyribonuclease V